MSWVQVSDRVIFVLVLHFIILFSMKQSCIIICFFKHKYWQWQATGQNSLYFTLPLLKFKKKKKDSVVSEPFHPIHPSLTMKTLFLVNYPTTLKFPFFSFIYSFKKSIGLWNPSPTQNFLWYSFRWVQPLDVWCWKAISSKSPHPTQGVVKHVPLKMPVHNATPTPGLQKKKTRS